MKRTWIFLLLAALLVSACSSNIPSTVSTAYPADTIHNVPIDTAAAYPVPTDSGAVYPAPVGACKVDQPCEAPTEAPATPDYLPLPADKDFKRGDAHIQDMDVVITQTDPVQGVLQITGELPTPCYHLRADVSAPDADNKIAVEVYTVVDPNEMCVQVIQTYSKEIMLGVLPAGQYSVLVNGTLVGQIVLP